ncbi:YbhB/YbcL family Raf kinase inhibitor-like protein [Halosimplex salinum]|uniref:YbhB/YbcL family Raf kinase inhibitor-like protein n=1 Tax=Halosimplex salinum TaxID=1710538 RepID=UPI000F483C72|nr:YbhB/YbcL family Raf kinase inhibitor-like protein [Halosimplex salinum]
MRRRELLTSVGAVATGGLAGCSAERETTTPAFQTSAGFESGESLPARFTCDGDGVSPPFEVGRVPEPTEALAVTAETDGGPLDEPVRWSIWNVPPETERIPAAVPRTETVPSLGGARQGREEGGEVGYTPPCPPRGGTSEYRFQVYALGDSLSTEGGATHDTATEAIVGATFASDRFTVEYTRMDGTDTD